MNTRIPELLFVVSKAAKKLGHENALSKQHTMEFDAGDWRIAINTTDQPYAASFGMTVQPRRVCLDHKTRLLSGAILDAFGGAFVNSTEREIIDDLRRFVSE